MTGQGNNRPNEVIDHPPVTLRRYRTDDARADVVWRLTRISIDRVT
jgi:hypothetical protein